MPQIVRCTAVLILLSLPLSSRAEVVTLELRDGRLARGELDGKTNEHYVWLRQRAAGVLVQSGLPWSNVQRAWHGDRPVSADLLRTAARGAAAPASVQPVKLEPVQHAVLADGVASGQPARVESLRIAARLGQWDGDAEPDGIEVLVFPQDIAGNLVPLRGQVELTLYVRAADRHGVQVPQLGPVRPLERVSQLVRPEDFADGPAKIRLPFTRFDPNVDHEVVSEALLSARLGAFGQGVFEATADCVLLRGSPAGAF